MDALRLGASGSRKNEDEENGYDVARTRSEGLTDGRRDGRDRRDGRELQDWKRVTAL